MKITVAQNSGFCFGVQNAVDTAYRACSKNPGQRVYCLGKLIHNETVTDKLSKAGILFVEDPSAVPTGAIVIIRSHGVGKAITERFLQNGVQVIDATCPFVKKIQKIVSEYYLKGYRIIILGEREHPEVIGINGWCENTALVVRTVSDCGDLLKEEKVCVVAQTTFPVAEYNNIIKKIQKADIKSLEIFDTICYTTFERQLEASKLSKNCDAMLVLGCRKSSNTGKLFEICKQNCPQTVLLETADDLKNIRLKSSDRVGIVAGASTPKELIVEVTDLMAQKFEDEINDVDFKAAMEEESAGSLREGKRIKGTVITADEKGITVNIGHKHDGFIEAADACTGEYNPADFPAGIAIEAVVLKTQKNESNLFPLSKKRIDEEREGNGKVEEIRDGQAFDLVMEKEIKGGLLGKLGSYSVFVPVSQVRNSFVKDLKPFVGKTLKLVVLEIDDNRRRIVASARKIAEDEKKAREEVFWGAVRPDVIVSGKVKRITEFGAFVSVDGFDCLVRIGDVSWSRIKSAEDVLKVGESYDFLVLSVDKEAGRVSLSYKLLQPDPLESFLQKHPIGSVTKGKVTLIKEFGAFVEVEPGIEGLVHVSEAAHSFVSNIAEVVKVNDEVEVMIMNVEFVEKKGRKSLKITLSMKACKPGEAPVDAAKSETAVEGKSAKGGKGKKGKDAVSEDTAQWSEESQNNPFAELLQGVDLGKDKK